MKGISTLDDLLERCWVDEITGCWIWRGAATKGRPSIWLRACPTQRGRAASAGTVLSALQGKTVPPGMCWVPRCGNKLCVSPEHRELQDRVELQRVFRSFNTCAHRARISAAWQARSKLTADDAEHIRQSPKTGTALAKEYGVTQSLVSRIRRGQTWAPRQGASVFNWRPA